jgi:hypothetical protein
MARLGVALCGRARQVRAVRGAALLGMARQGRPRWPVQFEEVNHGEAEGEEE